LRDSAVMTKPLENTLADVLDMVLSGESPKESDLADLGKPLQRSIQELIDKLGPGKVTFDKSRLKDYQQTLLDYARFDFSKSVNITPQKDELDALGLSINMTGEELQIAGKQVDLHKALQTSMSEKDALLKEVHHRVKNNMQIIASLLSLQANKIKDERLIKEFKSTQYRIRSMAMIHEILYSSGNFVSIDFGLYLQDLISALVVSMKGYKNKIETHIYAGGIQLNLDLAIPAGLLVNELITNSLEHGFPGDSSGRIEAVIKELPKHYELRISDNGVGFPVDCDEEEIKSLGLSLVDTLTLQLDGNIDRKTSNNGTYYQITFKKITQ